MEQQSAIWKHCLQHVAQSDLGLRRANNQDSMAVALAGSQQGFEQRGHLLMVADGMGAHAAGELASRIAADVVPLSYLKLADRSPPEAMVAAILDANAKIHARGEANPEFKGMGTTCTVLVLLPQGAVAAHVGDSRAYRVRGGRIEQLTFDHSLVWEMRRAGQLGDEAIGGFIGKNIITRSLGPNAAVQVDLEGPFPLEAGDTFLLCSDGLSGQVPDDEIGAVLNCLPLDRAVQALIDLANLRGGPDNITVVTARVTGPQVASGPEPESQAAGQAEPPRPGGSILKTLARVFGLGGSGYGEWPPGGFSGGRLFGRGPHVSTDCTPKPGIVDRLRDVAEELLQAATAQNWAIDLARCDEHRRQAAAAHEAGDFVRAAREYLHAVSLMMSQLKHQRPADDGSVSVL